MVPSWVSPAGNSEIRREGLFGMFYSIITRWDGRVIGNLARLAQLTTFCTLQATAPDCPTWRWQLAEALSVPFSLLSRAMATP